MKKLALHWQILIAILLAVLYGIYLPNQIQYISWMGEVFMRLLKMLVVPLVLCSLISGITNMGSNLGKIGLKTISYYLITSLLAILTGLVLVNLIRPGDNHSELLSKGFEKISLQSKPLSDTILEIIPSNIFEAFTSNNAMLSVIFFALLIGIFINKLKSDQRLLLSNFFDAFLELMMKITFFVIRLAPIGIFGLVAGVIALHSNISSLFSSLGMYMLTVVLGLLFHTIVTLPLFLYFVGKLNPIEHYKALFTPLLTAFTTASSNATLPVTMEAVEKNLGVSNRISSFTLPLGATVNMDGTALYELVVVGFIAQLYGIELSITQQFVLVVTTLISSIGAAGIPMGSLVTMTIIFSALGIPFEAVALILPIDRPLDMLRTSVNVLSDTCGAAIVASSEGETLLIKRKSKS